MNPWFARKVLYPLHERLRGRPTYRFLREFRRTESLAPAAVSELVDRRVRELVAHAARDVPWWRDWFASESLDPAEIRGASDLPRLPLMDKAFIRAHLERLRADGWRDRTIRLETGGSSGEPLIFYTDKDREASQLAVKARFREWFGIHSGDREICLWGSPIELSANDRVRELKDRLLNLRLLSAFRLSDEMMAGFREVIEAHRTQYLYGYASVLARFAGFLEERGEDLRSLGLKGAICTAELLFPDQEEIIGRVFGCPVINEYGCRDGGLIAQSCPEGRMHLAADAVHVEILSDAGEPLPAGQVGEIAVTNLWSYGFPLLRYRIGDRAARLDESCPCGRSLPLIGDLAGRVTDTLVTPDGNRVHGLGVMYVLRVLPGVDRFQVIQDARDHVEVLVVPAPGAGPEDLIPPVEEGLGRVLGPGVAIDVRLVDEIPVLPSGKMRSIWNRVAE